MEPTTIAAGAIIVAVLYRYSDKLRAYFRYDNGQEKQVHVHDADKQVKKWNSR
jgi:hypothetical protein